MSLVETHWSALSDALDAALDAPPSQRKAVIEDAFPDAPDLREEALALLQAATGAPTVLDGNAWDCAASWVEGSELVPSESSASLAPGTALGAYTIDSIIGTGGSSHVYKAQRSDGLFEQVVAIKVLRDNRMAHFAERFVMERQILAALDHPNIARVFDGGTTPNGYPYFVMEYVDGTPITEYCDTHAASVDERLALMQQVVDAVQYAHQQLVVHRDLKPTNILVTKDGTVRLLDFGIAKVLKGASSEHAPPFPMFETQTGYHPLTPGYAAPEQIEQEAITTRTDVYALGRVCYELLCGCRPVDVDTTGPYALMQAVCEGDLDPMHIAFDRKPSDVQEKLATQRSTDPTTLRRTLQGDLEAVVQQALSCAPSDRYGTAADFGQDVQRFLDDRPVHARTATPWYRVQRFISRNRWSVASTALALIVVLGYALTITLHSQQLAAERDKSEAVTTFLTDLFASSNLQAAPGNPDITVREVVDRGAARLDTDMDAAPLIQADLQATLGEVYNSLGLYDDAEGLLRNALETRIDASASSEDIAANKRSLGYLLFRTGAYEEADHYLTTALRQMEQTYSDQDPELGSYLNSLGLLYNQTGRGTEAESLFRRALAPDSEEQAAPQATYRHNLAISLQQQGRFDEAIPVHEEAIEAFQEHYGENHPSYASGLARYAFTLHLTGRLEDAAAYHEEALALRRDLLPAEHPHIASSLIRMGWVEVERGRAEIAEPMIREGLDMLQRFVPSTHWEMQAGRGILGIALAMQGDVDTGRAYLEETYNRFKEDFGADDWRTQRTRQALDQISFFMP